MSQLLLFNKPFGVLSQFGEMGEQRVLSEFIHVKGVYPAGRLDKDSEGLLLLTDDGKLQHDISHPLHKKFKTYWVQVEGSINAAAIQALQAGVQLKDGLTRPAEAKIMPEPDIWERTPPIRHRANIPTSWLELKIREGKNRQVRRMTAAVGFPTLRLIRYAIADWTLGSLAPGQWRIIEVNRSLNHDEQRSISATSYRGSHSRKRTTFSHGRGNGKRKKGAKPTRRTRGNR
jgi:23S rRNA pseudouridine2457 synthase